MFVFLKKWPTVGSAVTWEERVGGWVRSQLCNTNGGPCGKGAPWKVSEHAGETNLGIKGQDCGLQRRLAPETCEEGSVIRYSPTASLAGGSLVGNRCGLRPNSIYPIFLS